VPVIINSSAINLHGTATGGPTYQGGLMSGTDNTGLRFYGVNDNAQVSSGSAGPLALSGDSIIEFGVNAQLARLRRILQRAPQGGVHPYFLYVNGNGRLTSQIYSDISGSNNLSTADGGPGPRCYESGRIGLQLRQSQRHRQRDKNLCRPDACDQPECRRHHAVLW
jgi:hypothetical protein